MDCVRRLWQRCPLCHRVASRLAPERMNFRGLHAAGSAVAGRRKVVVVHKTSRLEFEKIKQPHLSETEIKDMVSVQKRVIRAEKLTPKRQ